MDTVAEYLVRNRDKAFADLRAENERLREALRKIERLTWREAGRPHEDSGRLIQCRVVAARALEV